MNRSSTLFGAGALALLLTMSGCSSSRDWVVVKRNRPSVEGADTARARPLPIPVAQEGQATSCQGLDPGTEAPGQLTCGGSQTEL